jgi:hypothetical protein
VANSAKIKTGDLQTPGQQDLGWSVGIDRGSDRLPNTRLYKLFMQHLGVLHDTFLEIRFDLALDFFLRIQHPMLVDGSTNNAFDLVENLG